MHEHYHDCRRCHRRYGFFNLLLDLIMIAFTGGLWIFWILFREIRHNN